MKITFLDKDTLGEDISLQSLADLGELACYGMTSEEQVIERASDSEVIITNKVRITDFHLEQLEKLKLICVAATGTNNIDLKACEKKGVEVKNVKGYSTESVAQTTLAMALSLKSNLPDHSDFGAQKWKDASIFTTMQFPYSELKGKTWGIVGLGAIGERVAKLAEAFGCGVIYYSTSGRNRNQAFQRGNLEDALKCDIVSVHCPMNEKTENLISKENLDLFKDDAVLINVARGGIVNERDIVDKFKESNIRLGFDVARVEPIENKSPLLEIAGHNRVHLSPHIAWASIEARGRLVEGIAKNIKDSLDILS